MSEPTTAPAGVAPVAADADLDRLLAPLDGLGDAPVAEHPAAYEQVHTGLRAVLAGEPVPGDDATRD